MRLKTAFRYARAIPKALNSDGRKHLKHSLTDEGALEIGARAAYSLLAKQEDSKTILVCDFEGAAEPMTMVFAKGPRAKQFRNLADALLAQAKMDKESA